VRRDGYLEYFSAIWKFLSGNLKSDITLTACELAAAREPDACQYFLMRLIDHFSIRSRISRKDFLLQEE